MWWSRAIAHEVKSKRKVSAFISHYLNFVLKIDPKKKIGGTNFGVRQQGLWRIAHTLVYGEYAELATTVLKEMNNSQTKRDLCNKLKEFEIDRRKDDPPKEVTQ